MDSLYRAQLNPSPCGFNDRAAQLRAEAAAGLACARPALLGPDTLAGKPVELV